MLLEIALALSVQYAGPCDLIGPRLGNVEYVSSCVVESGTSTTNGTVQLDKFSVNADPDWNETETPLGHLIWRQQGQAEDDDDYYALATLPVCINEDGTAETAGSGEVWFHEPVTQPVPTLGKATGALAFSESPCLAPQRRAAVQYLGRSDVPVDPNYADGWTDGVNQLEAFQVIILSPDYGMPGTFSININQGACVGSYVESVFDEACYLDNIQGMQIQVRGYRTDGTYYQNSVSEGTWFYGNNGYYINDKQINFTNVAPKLTDYYQITLYQGGAVVGVVYYYPPGHPLRTEGADGYDWTAVVVESDALNDMVYRPASGLYEYPANVCDSMDCVGSYCDGYGLDIVGFMGCLVWPSDIVWTDVWQSYLDGLQSWSVYQAFDFAGRVIKSMGYSFGAVNGACADLGPTSGRFDAVQINTCLLPQQSMVHNILASAVWIMFAFAVWRLLSTLLVTWRTYVPRGDTSDQW